MWAPAAQPNQPTQTPQAQSLPLPLLINQDEDASLGPQRTLSHEQLLLLQLEQAHAELNVYDAKLRALEEAQARGVPVQERTRNDVTGDTSVDESRAPPPQAVRVNPDIRMVVSDTQGMARAAAEGEVGMLVTSTSTVEATAEWSRLNMIRAPTTPPEERLDTLFQTVKILQESLAEKDQKLGQVRQMNGSLLTQLSAAKLDGEDSRKRVAQLQEEKGSLKEQVG